MNTCTQHNAACFMRMNRAMRRLSDSPVRFGGWRFSRWRALGRAGLMRAIVEADRG